MPKVKTDSNGHALKLRNVVAGYNNRPVLKNIDLNIPEGSLSIIMGRNGAGKTTLIKTIAGLTRVFQGEIIINNNDVTKLPPWKRDVALLLNPHPLLENKTVEENLGSVVNLTQRKGRIPRDPYEIAHEIGISNLLNKKAKELSRGQRQLVGLAQVFITNSKIMLMDEPFANLDYYHRILISRLIHDEVRRQASTVILATHEITDVMLTGSTRVLVLENGSLAGVISENDLVHGNILGLQTPLPNLLMSFIKPSSTIAKAIQDSCEMVADLTRDVYIAIPPYFVKIVLNNYDHVRTRDCEYRGLLLGFRVVAPGSIIAFVKIGEEILVSSISVRQFLSLRNQSSVCVKIDCRGTS